MSNPTFKHGPIGFDIATDLDKFRVVALNEEGKIAYANGTGGALGVVTETGRLEAKEPGAKNIAVHYGTAAVKVETDGEIAAGAAVYAAADGKVSATGTVKIGVAIRPTADGKTLTILNGLPTAGPDAA
mgnify:FL=1